jgi:hypothetical protein
MYRYNGSGELCKTAFHDMGGSVKAEEAMPLL